MKNKTSACTLQVINHLITIKKKIIRAHTAGTMDMSKLLHPWCAAWLEAVGSFLLIAQTCFFFCLLFWRTGEAKLSWAQQWTSPLMSARMRPLHAASPHVTKAHIPWQQEFRNGQTLSWPRELRWEGVPQSLPQGRPQSVGCLAAMLPPLGSAPPPARGMMALVSAGLKFDAPSLMFFTRQAFNRDYRLPGICW